MQWVSSTQVATSAAEAAQQTVANVNKVAAPSPKRAAVGAVQQSNTATATASTLIDADIAQWLGQFQTAGTADSQSADATQLHVNSQDSFSASQVAQVRSTNLNNVDVPALSRATNPSVSQSNDVSTVDDLRRQGDG